MELRDKVQELDPASIDDVSFTLSIHENDSTEPVAIASGSGLSNDRCSNEMDYSMPPDIASSSGNMDSSDKPDTDDSSDISASSILQPGLNKNNPPQPDTSTSSDNSQADLSDTPELSTSSPCVTTQIDDSSLSVTTHNSDKPPAYLQPPFTIPPPMGYDDNVQTDTTAAVVMSSHAPSCREH